MRPSRLGSLALVASGVATAVLVATAGPAAAASGLVRQASATGQIEARVLDGEGAPVAGVPVVLEVHDGQAYVHRDEAVSDPGGRVVFSSVPTGDTLVGRLGAEYSGVTYNSSTFQPGAEGVTRAEVRVAEVTSEGRPLHLDTLHIIIQAEDPTFYRVLQFVTVSNAGEAAWAGGPPLADGRPAGLVIPVPAAARSLQPAPFPTAADALPAAAIEDGSNTVLDPRPVPPSGRQAAITYDLVASDGPVDVRLPLPYPTQTVSVLLGGTGAEEVELTDTGLQQQPPEQIGEAQYESWRAETLEPGTEIRFRIGPRSEGLPAWAWGLVGLGVGLLAAVSASFRPRDVRESVVAERDRLVDVIARLDLDRSAGRLDEEAYYRRRSAHLERLMVLEERLASESTGPTAEAEDRDDSDEAPDGS